MLSARPYLIGIQCSPIANGVVFAFGAAPQAALNETDPDRVKSVYKGIADRDLAHKGIDTHPISTSEFALAHAIYTPVSASDSSRVNTSRQ